MEERKAYIGLTAADITELSILYGAVQAMAPLVVDDFYDQLSAIDEFQMLVDDRDTLSRMYTTMHVYLESLFCGRYDMDYARDRLRLGKIHFRIGVSESLLIAALYRLKSLIESRLLETGLIHDLPQGLHKIFLFDLQLIIDAYAQGYATRVRAASMQAHPHHAGLDGALAPPADPPGGPDPLGS